MPGLQSNSEDASHDRALVEALEKFCNSQEQSYEQFLSTFTHLTTANVTRSHLNVNRRDNCSSLKEVNRRDREGTDRRVDAVDDRESLPRRQLSQCALTSDLEELDNYLEDTESEEEPLHADQDVCVLPGEIEEDFPAYTPSFCHHTLLDLFSTATDHRTHSPQTIASQFQNQTEEVVPFTLDDSFDYDRVELSHKHPIQYSSSGGS